MYSVTFCYAILYFGLFEKAVSGIFFLSHGDKIWPISDKCLFGVCNDFEAYFDELMIRKVLF